MRVFTAVFFVFAGFGLAGCETLDFPAPNLTAAPAPPVPPPPPAWVPLPATSSTVQDPAGVKYYPSDEPLRLGIEHFSRGHYGLAERYFREATERAPKDASAWVGLAATYDRIGRYDLADRAYTNAISLVGETPEIMNDLGYSYMLRNDFPTARKYLTQAYEREPNNPYILNNLKLLNASSRSITRDPDVPIVPFNQ